MPLRVVTDPVEDGAGRRSAFVPPVVWGPPWLVGPVAPVTVVAGPPQPLSVSVSRGGAGEGRFVVENRQGAACLLRPMVTALTGPGGSRWAPVITITPRPVLVLPGERVEVTLGIEAPAGVPTGEHRGKLVLFGAGESAIQLAVTVVESDG